MAKRGRKPSNKRKGYFYEQEEEAILEYLSCEDEKRKEHIYMTIIHPAFTTMIESIIRRYRLYVPGETYEETFDDALSFLMTKLNKFEPGRYKAYSYYGTICKNYLIGKLQTFNKMQERNPLYSAVAGGFNNIKYAYSESDYGHDIASESIRLLIKRMNNMLAEKEKYRLKDSETRLGNALINLFENWDYILTTDGSPKLNKSVILLYLKENTGLDAKGIRDNIKKYKKEFNLIKEFLIK